jgi:hypothetical protein
MTAQMNSAQALKTITIPGRVWEDFLDPSATGMQAALGLTDPLTVKRGRGWSAVYRWITADTAHDLADYLRSRGELLLANSDPEYEGRERDIYRAAIRCADTIDASPGCRCCPDRRTDETR